MSPRDETLTVSPGWLPVAAVLLALSLGCSQGSNDPVGIDDSNEAVGPDTETVETPDPCSNALGNGNEIIPGPTAPGGPDFDQVFRSLAVDPSDPNTVYVGTERNGIVKTTDGGVTWERLRNGIRHFSSGYPEVWDIAVSPANSSLVIAATLDSPGPISGDYHSSVGGVYRSTDGGQSWTRSNCGLVNSRAVSVLFDPNDPAVVILGIEGGEASFSDLRGQYFAGVLLRSTDAGLTWTPATAPFGTDRNGYWHLRARGSSNTTFTTFGFNYSNLGQNLGFLRSTDGGQTWEAFGATLKNLLITAFDLSADGQVIYANERDSFEMRKSIDGGATWVNLPVPANGTVRLSPADPNLVLFETNGTVYRSTDGLISHAAVLSSPKRINDIEFASSNPSVVYAAAEGYDIYKSTDAGATFTLLVNLRSDGVIN